MESQRTNSPSSRAEPWITLGLCAAVLASAFLQQLVRGQPDYAESFGPDWLPLAAAGVAALSIIVRLSNRPRWLGAGRALTWTGLLLMVWAANGLPLDLLRVVPGLMPAGVDWPGMLSRMLALAGAVILTRVALEHTSTRAPTNPANWYGYAAFVLALTYPVLRTVWVLGGTVGLMWRGAAGQGFAEWLASVPWLLAAALSLLLVSSTGRLPRRALLAAGWSATAIVAAFAPAACWSVLATLIGWRDSGLVGIANWVPGLFYGSWFLWAIAAGAATRSYQLRSAAPRMSSST